MSYCVPGLRLPTWCVVSATCRQHIFGHVTDIRKCCAASGSKRHNINIWWHLMTFPCQAPAAAAASSPSSCCCCCCFLAKLLLAISASFPTHQAPAAAAASSPVVRWDGGSQQGGRSEFLFYCGGFCSFYSEKQSYGGAKIKIPVQNRRSERKMQESRGFRQEYAT